MGIHLVPVNDAAVGLHYNWEGWRWIRGFASRNGINSDQFAEFNDGEELDAATCRNLAAAIEKNRQEYNRVFGGKLYGADPADGHARIWRNSLGFEQW